MEVKRDGEPSSITKVRQAELLVGLRLAVSRRTPARLPPQRGAELQRALRQVLGVYVTTRELNPLLKGTGLTATSVQRSDGVRWVRVGRDVFYSLEDVRQLLASR